MKKSEQIRINQKVEKFIECFDGDTAKHYKSRKQLRHCSATVYIYDDYYVLVSYGTPIAVIDRKTDTLYDFLRFVYGDTSTSAQHIAKFDHDYGSGKWGCEARCTWREI